jgi:hypothetical protein
MQKHVLVFTASAFILVCGVIAASGQQPADSHSTRHPGQQQTQQQPGDQEKPGMMGHCMMGGGMTARGMMAPFVMRIIFALIDSDGDGTISLQEFQAAHERIFKAMDTDKDGTVSFEEMQNFMQGTRRSTPPR